MCVVRNLLFLSSYGYIFSRISHEIMLFFFFFSFFDNAIFVFGFQSLVFTDVATIAAADSLFLGGTWVKATRSGA